MRRRHGREEAEVVAGTPSRRAVRRPQGYYPSRCPGSRVHGTGRVLSPPKEFCKRRRCSRQAFDRLIKPLEERLWVKYEVFAREPVNEWEDAHLAKKLEGQPRRGRRMGRLSLTPEGKKFVHAIFPRHAKLVFAFMRALSMREQDTLIRVCRKLRDGNVVKLLDEMTMEE